MLITLEPKIFPKAAEDSPFKPAFIVTNHSGDDEINPKTTILKKRGLNLK